MEKVWIALLFALALFGLVNCTKFHSTSGFRHPSAQAVFNFGFKFLDELHNTTADDNIVISPESLYTALTLILPGLAGDTRAEVERVLGGLHLADIIGEHSEMNNVIFNNPDAEYKLYKASRLYVDHTVHLTKQYKADVFQALLNQNAYKRVDFKRNPEGARAKINKYVENHSNGEITDFLSENQVTALTRLFLVTALSLEAQWSAEFTRTKSGEFMATADEMTSVEYMMTDSASCYPYNLYYDENDKYAAVKIPFKATQLSMVIVMPKIPGDFTTINDQDIKDALEELSGEYAWPSPCQIIIPKFKIKTDISNAVPVLQKMGVSSIFNPDVADLSNMFQKDTSDIHVTDFTHEATLEVDEKGVKATAATGAGFSARMLPETVLINKPFLFIIRHEATGSSLFLGKVSKP